MTADTTSGSFDRIRKTYENRYAESFRMLNADKPGKYHIVTFGCQMNENDSERIAGMLEEMGYIATDNLEESDVVVFNTCCVRKSAEDRIYGRIGALKGFSGRNPSAVIAVGGCMMQQEGVAEYVRKKYPHVDIVFGTHDSHELPAYLHAVVFGGTSGSCPTNVGASVVEGVPVAHRDRLKAYVTISLGCSNYCSYCIVPFVRGFERSRQREDIISEVRSLAESGTKEVMLLGQNVNSYGTDLYGRTKFADLLQEVDGIDGLERIRFMTSHPKDFTHGLAESMRRCGKVCEHIHLPLQSGSDSILTAMNRKYIKAAYLEHIAELRDKVPGIAITTDIIVGFPGETEEDFLETLDVIRCVRFDAAYTFLYSERKDTPAAGLPDKVSSQVIKERFSRLVALQNTISREINQDIVGLEEEVLAEGPSKTDPAKMTGRTRSNKIVNFDPGRKDIEGRLVKVRIGSAGTWSLNGIPIG